LALQSVRITVIFLFALAALITVVFLGTAFAAVEDLGQSDMSADASVLDSDPFPATVMDFAPIDSLVMNDPLFGDSDYASGGGGFEFFVIALGSWSLVPSNLDDPFHDRAGEKAAHHCESDGSTAGAMRCEVEEGALAAVWDAASPAQQSPFVAAYLSPQQIVIVSSVPAAQKRFSAAGRQDAAGTFPHPADDDELALTPGTLDPTARLVSIPLDNLVTMSPVIAIPEIPSTAMMLIGFAGLVFVGGRFRLATPRGDKLCTGAERFLDLG
jgi:hypothetical protein